TRALALSGDLAVPGLAEVPPGRGRVTTAIHSGRGRPRVYDFIRREVAAGRQAYVVYPVIDETEQTDLKAASKMARLLAEEVFPDLTVALLHCPLLSDDPPP